MNEEIGMIEKSNTWQLVDKPQDKKSLGLNGFIESNTIRIA